MNTGDVVLSAYGAATSLLAPATGIFLRGRLRRGKEDDRRLGERSGLAGQPRPPGPVVWLHGASVGESLAVLPLIERLAARGLSVVLTTGTVSSARILAPRLPPGVVHQFVPLDLTRFMRRFLAHWRPALVMLAESELWPNLMAEVARRNVPLVLVNARLSARSFTRWRRARPLIGAMLGRTVLCLAQTDGDAERFAKLGAPRVSVAGHLKFDAPAPAAEPARVAELAAGIGDRPAWVAASTHAEEEQLVLAAHSRLAKRFPALLTIVVPRQTERGATLVERAAAIGLRAQRRSETPTLQADTQVYVADTMGEVGLFYSVVDLVFMGKSLGGSGGGQNPIEPAKLGNAVLHGTRVGNFSDIYRLLDEAGGAVALDDEAALADQVAALLADRPRREAMKRAAERFASRQGGASDRVMAAIEPFCRTMLAREPAF